MVDQPPDTPATSGSAQADQTEPVSTNDAHPKIQDLNPPTPSNDRVELLHKARAFLNSPQVRHEDFSAKRRFLADKGLNDEQIERLLTEMPPQAPLVPPRTYPQPPPSNLPALLLGIARIFSWIAGGSAAFLIIYFRFLYPRIAQTFQARHALHTHQKDLLRRLAGSLESLKAAQAETAAVLPRPALVDEAHYKECQTLDEVIQTSEGSQDVPDVTLLRCALADLVAETKPATAEAIFLVLDGKVPWLRDEEGSVRHVQLWDTLTSSPLFHEDATEDASLWTYTHPLPPPTPPLMQSLHALKASLPPRVVYESHRFQYTLNTLTDLTGYIVTRTHDIFRVPFEPAQGPGMEEEVKREIRALKGLVLNRRAFMPTLPRPPSYTPASPFTPSPVNPP
ncbi:uncharacterized protein C8Q71DRAFT_725515 [Rhodofomes roseus]|uniref:Peroxisome membrane anchor protein Pex14p N-terminal domain-containing protein n=1 Tax=Rhodofomes roseus TaxID=34475 RepID=A0ABQ8KA42_9APHY|nr:uncharacterized protein C8Q71DRAFT_725515 [Rhodofomes roseus]KAH9833750.1 hypothetical protein C8Q71DRAFT_725515 [Rhodofomes roseus]